jgi:hypothetical protein
VAEYQRRAPLPPARSDAVILKHAKQRGGLRHPPIWFTLEDVEPGKSVCLRLGGVYSEDGQGIQAGIQKAVTAIVAFLKTASAYQKTLGETVLAGGLSIATYRRALAIVKGKKPWPYGPLRGKKQPVVTEDQHGRQVFLTFDAAAWPADEEWDDA